MIAFRVYGEAQPQGSARAFTPKGWSRPIITTANPSLKTWRQLVATAANDTLNALPANQRALLLDGVRLTVAFYLPRPKSLAKRTTAHTKNPDLDKLVRSICDSLTAICFTDDKQVCELVAAKHYAPVGGSPYVDVRVEATAGVARVSVPAARLPLFGAVAP